MRSRVTVRFLAVISHLLFLFLPSEVFANSCGKAIEKLILSLPSDAPSIKRRVIGSPSRPIRVDIWGFHTPFKNRQGETQSAIHMVNVSTPEGYFEFFGGGAVVDLVFYDMSPSTGKLLNQKGLKSFDPMMSLIASYTGRHEGQFRGEETPLPSLLTMLQEFSLAVMEGRSAIDHATRKKQEQISETIDPSAITFFEISEAYPEREVPKDLDKKGPVELRRSEFTDSDVPYMPQGRFDHENPTFYYKTGAVWLVNGSKSQLPLETEPLEKQIDRTAGKAVFEIGRAAQTTTQGFAQALRSAAYTLFEISVFAHKSPEDILIYAHCLDPQHAELYKRLYGMSEYSKVKGAPQETILVSNLKTLLEIAPVEGYTEMSYETHKATQGRITEKQVLEFWRVAMETYRQSGVGLYDKQKQFIAGVDEVRDFSGFVAPIIFESKLRNAGVSQDLIPIIRNIMVRYLFKYQAQKRDLAVHDPLTKKPILENFLRTRKAIELSGLVAQRGISFSDAVGVVFGKVWWDTLHHLKEAGVSNPDEAMVREGVQFILTSIPRGTDLSSMRTKPIPPEIVTQKTETMLFPGPSEKSEEVDVHSIIFTAAQLRAYFGTR